MSARPHRSQLQFSSRLPCDDLLTMGEESPFGQNITPHHNTGAEPSKQRGSSHSRAARCPSVPCSSAATARPVIPADHRRRVLLATHETRRKANRYCLRRARRRLPAPPRIVRNAPYRTPEPATIVVAYTRVSVEDTT